MAAATTEVNLIYGQWTNVAPLNERCVITPQSAIKCKLLVKFQTADPGSGDLVGHEVIMNHQKRNINLGADASAAIWMRPLYPATNVQISITRY